MNNNNLDALFTGLTRTNTEETVSKQPTALPPSVDERKGKKATPSTKQPEERFCTIVSSALLRKIRIIANREGLQIKEVVNAAFEKAVKSYERKYGTVDGEVKRSAKDLF